MEMTETGREREQCFHIEYEKKRKEKGFRDMLFN